MNFMYFGQKYDIVDVWYKRLLSSLGLSSICVVVILEPPCPCMTCIPRAVWQLMVDIYDLAT